MRTRTRTLLAVAALAGVAVWLLAPRSRPPAHRSFRWPVGVALTYDLTLSSTDTAALSHGPAGSGAAPSPVEARTTLRGQLRVHRLPADGEHVTLGLRLVALDTASVTIAGREALQPDDRAALSATDAVAELEPDGTVAGLSFAPGTPEVVQNLYMLVATETAVTLGGGARWTAAERTLQGTAVSRYRVVGSAGPRLTLARERRGYHDLTAARAAGRALSHRDTGDATVVVDDGVLARLEAHETLRVGGGEDGTELGHDVSATLVLRTRAAVAARLPPPGPVRQAGELAVRDGLEARMLAQRVDGLDGATLLDTLAHAGPTGQVPDHNRFLWRATGLLRQQPALAAELGRLFDAATTGVEGRALILDLLVGAGNPASQEALRGAIERGRAAGAPGFAMLYQRLGLIAHPDAATLYFARARAQAPGPEGRDAALASYGAVAGKRLRDGDPRARADVDALVAGLTGAGDAEEQKAHLLAVANARDAALEPTLAAFAAAPDWRVRRATAQALFEARGDVSRRALVGLGGDPDGEVQRQALISIGDRRLPDADLTSLAAVVDRGGMGETGYDALLDVVADDLDRGEARAVVEAVLRQPVQNVRVLGRARQLLAAAAAAPE